MSQPDPNTPSAVADDLAAKIREANVRLHDEKAREFDQEEIHMHKARVQQRTEALVDFAAEAARQGAADTPRLLDVGCGTGNLSVRLAKRGFDVTGLDISSGMLEIYQQKLGCQARTVHSDCDAHFAQSDEKYDLITFSAALHHVPDYQATLRAAAAHLNPKGVLVIHHEHRHAADLKAATRFVEHLDIRLYGIAYKWRHHRSDFLAAIGRKLGLCKASESRSDDIRLADYHVFDGGVSEPAVKTVLEDAGLQIIRHDTYQELRLDSLNALASTLKLHGLYNLVAQRTA